MPSSRPTARRRVMLATLLGVFFLFAPASTHAGPWVKSPGTTYAKLSGSYFGGTGMFDVDGNFQQPDYSYSHFGIRAYTEVGLFPHVSLTATAPFRSAMNSLEGDSVANRGFGDLELAAKVGTKFEACAVAGIVSVRVPLYSGTISPDADATGAQQGQNASELDQLQPALGDGSYDATPAAAFGCGIPPIEGWASAQVGPTLRSDGFGTSLSYSVTAGSFVIPDRLGIKLNVGGIERLQTDNRRPTKRYLQISGGPLIRIAGPVSFEATASYIPTGAFVSRGWGVSAGVSYDGRLFPNPWE